MLLKFQTAGAKSRVIEVNEMKQSVLKATVLTAITALSASYAMATPPPPERVNGCKALLSPFSADSLKLGAAPLQTIKLGGQEFTTEIMGSLRLSPRTPSKTLPDGGVLQLGNNLYRASIAENRFEFLSAPESLGVQEQANWCWAACIKMTLNYYDIPITQAQIVSYIHGAPVNKPGSTENILRVLNNLFATETSQLVRARAALIDPNSTAIWVQLLANKRPVIAALAGVGANPVGHAVLIKGVDFSVFPGGVQVHSVILSDPGPNSPSETTMGWEEFSKRNQGVFVIY
jgi:hypothetical protein